MENEALPLENELTFTDGTDDTEVQQTPIGSAPEDEAGEDTVCENDRETPEAEPDFASLAAHDLSALQAAFPELSDMGSLSELPEPERYGELREAGLSPIEAFCASHHKMLISHRTDNRTHLSPSIGRAASTAGGRISAAALADARDLFPSLSDREIEALYRRVSTTR